MRCPIRYFILGLILTSWLFAANPKTYASIGDPVYNSVAATSKLITVEKLTVDFNLIQKYIEEANQARKEGFWLDKYPYLPESETRRKAYIDTLRTLGGYNKQISKIVKDTMLKAIKSNDYTSYLQLKKSRYPVLTDDADLKREIKNYEAQVRQQTIAREKRHQQKKHKDLRSIGNLKGQWKSVSDQSTIILNFENEKTLSHQSISENTALTLEGEWEINQEQLVIKVSSITRQRTDRPAHTRKSTIILTYTVMQISNETIILEDKNSKALYFNKSSSIK